jgi:hypothetical protein
MIYKKTEDQEEKLLKFDLPQAKAMQMNKTNPILRIFILLQLLNENESD